MDFLCLAIPSILARIGDFAFYIINILYAGQLGDENILAGVGLGQTISYVLLFSFFDGTIKPMETFTTQAFESRDLHLCGVYLHRARLIMTLFFIPTAIMTALCSRSILVSLG